MLHVRSSPKKPKKREAKRKIINIKKGWTPIATTAKIITIIMIKQEVWTIASKFIIIWVCGQNTSTIQGEKKNLARRFQSFAIIFLIQAIILERKGPQSTFWMTASYGNSMANIWESSAIVHHLNYILYWIQQQIWVAQLIQINT